MLQYDSRDYINFSARRASLCSGPSMDSVYVSATGKRIQSFSSRAPEPQKCPCLYVSTGHLLNEERYLSISIHCTGEQSSQNRSNHLSLQLPTPLKIWTPKHVSVWDYEDFSVQLSFCRRGSGSVGVNTWLACNKNVHAKTEPLAGVNGSSHWNVVPNLPSCSE